MSSGVELLRMERGLQALVARALGVTRGAVTKWRQVPAERVLAVEKATGIPRERLRPDLYKPRRRRNGG
jgi:DNA-binding transcriptional regulator YdaS (Cro superfamily)